MRAGSLDRRVTFQRRQTGDDGYGNAVLGPWADLLTVWGRLVEKAGREAVAAGRLENAALGELHVRDSAAARAVLPSDRAMISGVAYQIRDIRPPQRWGMIEMVVERGVAN